LKFKNRLSIQGANRPARSQCRGGAAMLEFAIVLPILLLLIMGIIEKGPDQSSLNRDFSAVWNTTMKTDNSAAGHHACSGGCGYR